MIKKLFLHSSIYFAGLLCGKMLSILVFILFARTLQPEAFGDFVFFITLLQTVTFFADAGLIHYYQTRPSSDLFKKIIVTRLYTLFISSIIAVFILTTTPFFHIETVILFLLTLIPEAFLSIADAHYLTEKKSFIISLKTISRMGILLVGYFLCIHFFSLITAFYLYFISGIITVFWFYPYRWKKIEKSYFISVSENFSLLKSASTYALLIITSFAYSRGDALIMRYSLNNAALGLYSTAYRYLDSLSLLPTALSQNLFHISAQKNGTTIQQLIKITLLMSVMGGLCAIFLYYASDLLIINLVGESYRGAIPIVQIFSAVTFLFFVNAPLSTVVQSSPYIKKFLPFGIGNTILNLILNILFLPQYGIIAAAWIMAFTELSGLLINIFFVKKIYE
jgi:O-antigen/teichoic acid export membrane protein